MTTTPDDIKPKPVSQENIFETKKQFYLDAFLAKTTKNTKPGDTRKVLVIYPILSDLSQCEYNPKYLAGVLTTLLPVTSAGFTWGGIVLTDALLGEEASTNFGLTFILITTLLLIVMVMDQQYKIYKFFKKSLTFHHLKKNLADGETLVWSNFSPEQTVSSFISGYPAMEKVFEACRSEIETIMKDTETNGATAQAAATETLELLHTSGELLKSWENNGVNPPANVETEIFETILDATASLHTMRELNEVRVSNQIANEGKNLDSRLNMKGISNNISSFAAAESSYSLEQIELDGFTEETIKRLSQ